MAKKKKPLLLLLLPLLLLPQLLLLTPLLQLLLLPPQPLLPLLLKARRSNSSSLNAGAVHRHFSQEKARQLAGFFFGNVVWNQRISGASSLRIFSALAAASG